MLEFTNKCYIKEITDLKTLLQSFIS